MRLFYCYFHFRNLLSIYSSWPWRGVRNNIQSASELVIGSYMGPIWEKKNNTMYRVSLQKFPAALKPAIIQKPQKRKQYLHIQITMNQYQAFLIIQAFSSGWFCGSQQPWESGSFVFFFFFFFFFGGKEKRISGRELLEASPVRW